MKNDTCHCHRCLNEKLDNADLNGSAPDLLTQLSELGALRMILCPACGNKRCPHATDHRLTCTGSNEPGQPGSVYQ